MESESQAGLIRAQSGRKRNYVELLAWGLAFLLFRLAVQTLGNPTHFYRDEITFIEAALRMPLNGFNTGDYIHGPIISYMLLAVYAAIALIKLVLGQIGGANDFIRWYIEHPQSLGEVGRLLMSIGGAALIVVTMALARSISGSRQQMRVAALMLLSMPLFHHTSWYIKEDVWAALLGAGAALVAYRRGSARWAGLAWGAAIAAKYTAVALGPALLLVLIDRDNAFSSWKAWLNKCTWVGVSAIAAFAVLNPYTIVNMGSFVNQIGLINSQYLQGDFLSGGSPPFLASRLLTEFLPFDVGILAVLSISAGLAFSRFKQVRSYLPALVASATVMVMVALSRSGFPRTLALALPWLAILASASYQAVLGSRFSKTLIGALGVVTVLQVAGYYRYVTAANTAQLAQAHVESFVAKDAVVLMEDVHDYVADAAPPLKRNITSLRVGYDDLLARGAVGRLSKMRQSIASESPAGRYEILGVKEFSEEGKGYLGRADVLITCKWPSIFPENRQFNLPEESRIPVIARYQQERQRFLEAAGLAGFRPIARFEPSLVARWSFIDRPDPSVLSPVSWLTRRPGVAGPEIAIYVRSTELEAQDIIVKRSPWRAE